MTFAPAFDPTQLARVFDEPRVEQPFAIKDNQLYVAIDPSYGSYSDTAVVSFIVTENEERVVIVGLESHDTHYGLNDRQVVAMHIDALMAQRQFATCTIVLIPEANLGSAAQMLSMYLMRRCHSQSIEVKVLCEFHHFYGAFSTVDSMEKYVLCMRTHLAVENRVRMAANIVSVVSSAHTDMVGEFRRQMAGLLEVRMEPHAARRYQSPYSTSPPTYLIEETTTPHTNSERAPKQQDSMCTALLMGLCSIGRKEYVVRGLPAPVAAPAVTCQELSGTEICSN